MIRKSTIFLILALLALTTLACGFSAIRTDDGGMRVTVSLTEEQINTLLSNSTNQQEGKDAVLKEITKVDMQDGLIRVFGKYDKANGKEADGSYDVAMRAENGQLKVEITAVDVEGLSVSDARIQKLNDKIAQEMAKSYTDNNGHLQYESVKITDQALTLVVKTDKNGK